ncbi:uncharacterized protein LOC111262345 isoform X2 [Varroa jacobsoni]|uniref:uncharacterized protein LOC111262345 isoform X2 n=1 Tax=Varroa jacobsoni TaxID=62625 RepID=UPI000BF61FB8|nr:uncharacterized protein LOC111262345 isoform X2 [Varroa jacobsoni]
MMVPFPFVIILMVQLSGKGKPMITYKIDQNILVSVDLIGVREFTELGVLTTKLLLTLSNVKIMAQPYDSAIVIILVLVASAGRLTEANSIEEGMKELDKLSRVLQEPILDDTKIREMVRVDKIPIDEALKDLLAVIKFMTVEHQLTLQSLRIVSVALEKLAKRMHFAAHPDGAHTSTKVEEEADTSVEHHELIRRAILRRIRRNAAIFEKSSQADDPLVEMSSSASKEAPKAWSHSSISSSSSASSSFSSSVDQDTLQSSDTEPSNILDEGIPVYLTDSDKPRSRRKRFFFDYRMYLPWLWGAYWAGYGYGYLYPYYGKNYYYYYPYFYHYPYSYGYYPYYYYYYYTPVTQTTTAPAALRRPLKRGKK